MYSLFRKEKDSMLQNIDFSKSVKQYRYGIGLSSFKLQIFIVAFRNKTIG